MENTPLGIAKENLERWQVLGYEVVHSRGTVRIPHLRKEFDKDTLVTVYCEKTQTWAPVILKSSGRPLKACEVLPERADLALREDGRVLHQGDFEANYRTFLEAWAYGENADPNWEYVPNVIDYISHEPDKYSESRGPIEIGFDPKLNQEFVPKEYHGPNGETMEEWEAAQKSKSGSSEKERLMEMLLKKIDSNALADIAKELVDDHNIPVIEGPGEDDTPIAAAPEPAPKPETKVLEAAPCGKQVTKGYVAQHVNHCNKPECKE